MKFYRLMLVWKPKQLTKRIASSGLCSIHLFWLVMIILSPAEFKDDQKCSRNWRFSCMAARKNRQWWYALNVVYSFWKYLVFFFFPQLLTHHLVCKWYFHIPLEVLCLLQAYSAGNPKDKCTCSGGCSVLHIVRPRCLLFQSLLLPWGEMPQ